MPDVSGFQVGVGALAAPAQRLKQISADLGSARSGAGTAAGGARGAAGDPRVAAAAEVFGAGVTAVLGALGDDAGLLADKVQRAGVTYEAVDRRPFPPSERERRVRRTASDAWTAVRGTASGRSEGAGHERGGRVSRAAGRPGALQGGRRRAAGRRRPTCPRWAPGSAASRPAWPAPGRATPAPPPAPRPAPWPRSRPTRAAGSATARSALVRLRHRAGDRGRGGRPRSAGRPTRPRSTPAPRRPGPARASRTTTGRRSTPASGRQALAPLRMHYRSVIETLDRAAGTAAGRAHRRGPGIPLGNDAGPALPRRPGRGGAAAAERARAGRAGPGPRPGGPAAAAAGARQADPGRAAGEARGGQGQPLVRQDPAGDARPAGAQLGDARDGGQRVPAGLQPAGHHRLRSDAGRCPPGRWATPGCPTPTCRSSWRRSTSTTASACSTPGILATCCTSAARSAPGSCSRPATSSTRWTRRARTARCTRWSAAG